MSESNDPKTPKLPYTTPRLACYGDVRELTRTVNDNMNKNDALQGGNNLKT
jgi:hypothetical protein